MTGVRSGQADLSARLLSIGSELVNLAHAEVGSCFDFGLAEPALLPDDNSLAEIARQIYGDRRRRTAIFASGLFGEPAWDILLDLYIASVEGTRIATTSACIAADVPSTTALRWLRLLEEKGLITREPDGHDGRRFFVQLSPLGFEHMSQFLAGCCVGRAAPLGISHKMSLAEGVRAPAIPS